MKSIILLTLLLLSASLANAQVTYRTVPKAPEKPTAPYDSLEVIPHESIRSIYGQTALVLDTVYFHPERSSFIPIRNTGIVNKQFDIVGAQRNKYREIWLTMVAGSDTVYYKVTGNSMDFPTFVTLGYYDKQKQLYTGKKFNIRLDGAFNELNTGKEKVISPADNFTCTGASVICSGRWLIPSLILKNSKGEEIAVPMHSFEKTTAHAINRFVIK